MKKSIVFFKFIIVFLTVILFTQCEKDDSTPSVTNTIKMNGNDFTIMSASMIGVSMGDYGHTSISFVSGSGTQTNSLTINVDSYTQETIEGDYAYPEVSGKKLLDDWLTDYTVYDGTNIISSNLETGEVSINYNGGNNYTVDVNLQMTDEVTFLGSYTGDFQVIFNNQ